MSDVDAITPQHIANLRNHADFVEAQPSIYMGAFAFVEGTVDYLNPNEVTNECGAAMCAVGLVPLNADMPSTERCRDWSEVCRAAFGFDENGYLNNGIHSFYTEDLWEETFGGDLPDDPATIANGMRRAADQIEAWKAEAA